MSITHLSSSDPPTSAIPSPIDPKQCDFRRMKGLSLCEHNPDIVRKRFWEAIGNHINLETFPQESLDEKVRHFEESFAEILTQLNDQELIATEFQDYSTHLLTVIDQCIENLEIPQLEPERSGTFNIRIWFDNRVKMCFEPFSIDVRELADNEPIASILEPVSAESCNFDLMETIKSKAKEKFRQCYADNPLPATVIMESRLIQLGIDREVNYIVHAFPHHTQTIVRGCRSK